MLPAQLTAAAFNGYPPEAKRLAISQIALLRKLPLAFAPLLLRELIFYDWKFPAERRDIDKQFAWLSTLTPAELQRTFAPFAQLRLLAGLDNQDWVDSPAAFSEQLSAHLWATHQIDAFRAAAVEYVSKTNAAAPDPPPPAHRLGIAIVGLGAAGTGYEVFRKLRPRGTYFSRIDPRNGVAVLLDAVTKRADAHKIPYAHWYIDGASQPKPAQAGLASVSYTDLVAVRNAVQTQMQKGYDAGTFDPEKLRSMLARTTPEEVGLAGPDPVMNRFQLSLLTEGSGTQVFSTTFVQWAAREALRRAQPLTMLIRFTPRSREKPMNELLYEARNRPEPDPEGSLIDADMGAYYTWLNQQRLPGASESRFLTWFEDRGEAVAIGPGFTPGAHSDEPASLTNIARRLI